MKRFKVIKGLSRLAVAALLLTSGVISIDIDPAYGCSCAIPDSASESRDRATAVFVGEVVDITPLTEGYDLDIGSGETITTGGLNVAFEVIQQFKGGEATALNIRTPGISASCGYTFEQGTSYLVYAFGEENDLQVMLCSRTSPVDSAEADIIELGGTVPSSSVNSANSEPITANSTEGNVDRESTRSPGCQSIK